MAPVCIRHLMSRNWTNRHLQTQTPGFAQISFLVIKYIVLLCIIILIYNILVTGLVEGTGLHAIAQAEASHASAFCHPHGLPDLLFTKKSPSHPHRQYHVSHRPTSSRLSGDQAIFWPQRAITPPELFGAESLGDQTPDGRAVGGGSGPFGFAPTRWEQRRATRVWLNDWVCRACSANLLDGWEGSS